MIKSQNKVSIPSVKGGGLDLEVEMNYNKSVTEDRVFRVTLGDKETLIKFEDLFGLVFLTANEHEQDSLMPVKSTTITKFTKQHRVRVQKNLKKGDEVIVNCEIDVPVTVTEGLKGLLSEKKKSSIIVP